MTKTMVLGPPPVLFEVEGLISLMDSLVEESIVVVLFVAHEGLVRMAPDDVEEADAFEPAQVAGRSSTGGGSFCYSIIKLIKF
jgi:hypothetical protein